MSERAPSRADVWRALGEPHEKLGSVNEPRVQHQVDAEWNEQWIYRVCGGPDDGRPERVVLWLRGEFVAAFRVGDDGGLAREDLAVPMASGPSSPRS